MISQLLWFISHELKAFLKSTGITLDPLATGFTWSEYQASSHRKPLGVHSRPSPMMTVHPTIRPGVTTPQDMRNLTDPWLGDWNDKKKAHEKFIDGFRLWQDDMSLWKGVTRGEYSLIYQWSTLHCAH